jgi:hypothetical protein
VVRLSTSSVTPGKLFRKFKVRWQRYRSVALRPWEIGDCNVVTVITSALFTIPAAIVTVRSVAVPSVLTGSIQPKS